jgi:hypothetical protein
VDPSDDGCLCCLTNAGTNTAYVHGACTNSREIYSPRARSPRCTQLRDREYSGGNLAALQNGQFRRDSPAITYYMTRRRHFVAIARDQEPEIARRWRAAPRLRHRTSARTCQRARVVMLITRGGGRKSALRERASPFIAALVLCRLPLRACARARARANPVARLCRARITQQWQYTGRRGGGGEKYGAGAARLCG